MNSRQIQAILQGGIFSHPFTGRQLIETHISYVLLGGRFAYKFKKEIKYSFLDFSTLNKRKYYCEREVLLNNRLSKGVYLKVVPVREVNKEITVDGTDGKIVDYAIKMKRLNGARQMHLMLEKNLVTKKHIKMLADLIRNFHGRTEVIRKEFQQDHFASRFNDILSVAGFLGRTLDKKAVATIKKAVRISDTFLNSNHDLFAGRVEKGFIRDCHGDLHSRNIFLYARPIIFDCIEFNDEFRQTDILDELAFFCMDLEAEGNYSLSNAFTNDYFARHPDQFGRGEQLLFTYYKCYRANVRAKVNALRAMEAKGSAQKKNLDDVKKYLALMESYLAVLSLNPS